MSQAEDTKNQKESNSANDIQEPINRRLKILKLLQGREMRTAEIAELFDVEDRTIRTDLNALKAGMKVMGTTVKIEEQRSGHSNLSYKSTVHPVFLALNLSEVFALLKSLKQSAENSVTGDIYRDLFHTVYGQLTDYAKKMIDVKLESKDTDSEADICNHLEEEWFDKDKAYKLIYLEKSGSYFPVTYTDENGNIQEEEVRLIDIRGEKLKLKCKGKDKLIQLNYGEAIIDWSSIDYK